MSIANNELVCIVQKEKREKVQKFLGKNFELRLSIAIENEIYKQFYKSLEAYISKATSIRNNIHPQKNTVLYSALVAGDISVTFLVGLSVQEMATDEKKRSRASSLQRAFFESRMTEKTRKFQRNSVLFEDSTKKTKLFPNSDSVGNF